LLTLRYSGENQQNREKEANFSHKIEKEFC